MMLCHYAFGSAYVLYCILLPSSAVLFILSSSLPFLNSVEMLMLMPMPMPMPILMMLICHKARSIAAAKNIHPLIYRPIHPSRHAINHLMQ
ncbi:uncharacterized protein IWZ02DRAFT_465247 [Phyllosticta citriasiana]|uniref:NADH dehydrogenase subunit 4L n=1 Tax=Phyllosticta citriasiana TaxID=595635 RepID=A0ABR1KVY3_9PEZI